MTQIGRSPVPEEDPDGQEAALEAGAPGHPGLRLFWKLLSIGLGGALILLGLVGLFLPVLQGWLMIFAGLAILGPHSSRARRILRLLKEKVGWKDTK